MVEATGIGGLPAELQQTVCLWLGCMKDLLRLAAVSHSYRSLFLYTESLWRSVVSGAAVIASNFLLLSSFSSKEQWNIDNLCQSFIEHSRNIRAMRLLSLRPFSLPPEPHFYRDLYQNLLEYHSDFFSPTTDIYKQTRGEPILYRLARELMQQHPLMTVVSAVYSKLSYRSEWQVGERDRSAPSPPLTRLPFAYGVRDTDEGRNYVALDFSVGFPGRRSSWLYAALVDPADAAMLTETMKEFIFVSLAHHNDYEYAASIWFRRVPKFVAVPLRSGVAEIISGCQHLIDEYIEIVSAGMVHATTGRSPFDSSCRQAHRVWNHLKLYESSTKALVSYSNLSIEEAARPQLQRALEAACRARLAPASLSSFWDAICFSTSLEPRRTRTTPSGSPHGALVRCTRRACYSLLLPKLKNHYSSTSWKDETQMRCLFWAFALGGNELTEYRDFPPREPGVKFVKARLQSMIDAAAVLDIASSNISSWPLWAHDLFERIARPVAKICADAAVCAITSQTVRSTATSIEGVDFEELRVFLERQIDEGALGKAFEDPAGESTGSLP